MAIFVSYARRDQAKVQHLVAKIRQLGYEAWADESLRGGQRWWDEILEQIRHCDALLVVVSPASLQSHACTLERQYATMLGRPLLPVLVEPVPHNILPAELAVLQATNYAQPGEAAAFALASAVMRLPAAEPLPDPLPPPPPVPLSYLTSLSHRMSVPILALEEQLDIVGRLETGLRAVDPEEREGARELLTVLARRGDLFVETQRRIDRAMPEPVTPSGPGPAGAPASPVYPGYPGYPGYPAPTGRSSRGLVLALAGGAGVLIIALVASAVVLIGDRGTGPSVTTPNPTSTTAPPDDGPFPNPAEQGLLNYIPSSVKADGDCRRGEMPIDAQAGSITCDPNSAIRVHYYQFSNAQEMNSTFDDTVAGEQLRSGGCEPDQNSEFSGHGTWGTPTAGRVACYLSSGGPWIEWTHDSLKIYSYTFAIGDDNQDLRQQLFDFWLDAGPS